MKITYKFADGTISEVEVSEELGQAITTSSGNTVTASTSGAPSINSYLTVTSNGNVVAVLKVTKSNQNYCVLAYNNTTYPSTSVTVTNSTSINLTNDLYYVAK